MTTTPWFDGSVKPARRGVYRRQISDQEIVFSYFDGALWYVGYDTAEGALHNYRERSMSIAQCSPWCGLAQKP